MSPTKKEKDLLINVQKLYENLEAQSEWNSINQQYRMSKFIGMLTNKESFSGKFGETTRYLFTTESGENWSLLSSSKILDKVSQRIPLGTKCEVFKNEKGIWMILPYLE